MKDFIKKYQNHKLMTNINIILASLILAIFLNFFVIDSTNIGQSLKTSILNSKVGEEKADLYLQKIDNELFLVANKNMNNLDVLSLSLIYNPDNVSISEIRSELGEIANLGNEEGIKTIILSTDKAKNITRGERILKIVTSKKEEKSENINIVNANFTDSNKGQFLLSTSGITF
ncbi:MAG: hypothetical protein Q8K30_00420 [Candidatus Gracilibacteria bacterium]|nr:hypothetical protein [Candidatus Gracilibacteria bacterium]